MENPCLSDGTKREVVKQDLLEHPDRFAEDTQQVIATDLGVSREPVRRATDKLEGGGEVTQACAFSTERSTPRSASLRRRP